jgi:hypothetical protein
MRMAIAVHDSRAAAPDLVAVVASAGAGHCINTLVQCTYSFLNCICFENWCFWCATNTTKAACFSSGCLHCVNPPTQPSHTLAGCLGSASRAEWPSLW